MGSPGIHNSKLLVNCRYKINLKNIKLITMLIIAAKEEYFSILTVINQHIENVMKNGHEVAKVNAIKLATPLPPLNFSQIGKMCPITAKNPLSTPVSVPK